MPKVSVIMPVFNRESVVAESIYSILNQTFADFELIVYDDGSTDNTRGVVQSLTDGRIRLIRGEENAGTARAGNQLFEAATGEFIVRQDSDDIAVPDRISWQVEFMDAHPEIGVSSGHIQLFGKEEETWKTPLEKELVQATLPFAPSIAQGAMILRRDVIADMKEVYEPNWPMVGEDWLLWCKLSGIAQMANLDQVLLRYRIGEGNLTRSAQYASWESRKHLIHMVLNTFDIPFTSEQLDYHNFSAGGRHRKVEIEDVSGVRDWLDSLITWNAARKQLDEDALQSVVNQRWDRFFYMLDPSNKEQTKRYFELTGEEDPVKKKYLRRSKLAKWLGR